MPKIARQHATHGEVMAGFEGRYQDLDGYTIGFGACTQDAGPARVFQGLPGRRGRVTWAASAVAAGVRPGQAGQERMWPEARLLRGGGGIAEDTTYCTGIWDGPAIARHKAEAPMVWR